MEPKQIFRCMTCNGFGTVSRNPAIAGDIAIPTDKMFTCPTCQGRGYIVLEEPEKEKTQ